MRKVVLKKVVDDGRKVLIGTEFPYTYVTLDRGQAERRASKALLRQFPDEDRASWALQPEVVPEYLKTDDAEVEEAPAAA